MAWRSVHEQDAHRGSRWEHRAGRPQSAGAGGDVERDNGVTAFVGGHAVLLANHGPVVAGATLEQATDAIEELEETAELHPLLRGQPTRPLTPEQAAVLAPPSS